MSQSTTTVVLVGVGGQGTILAAELLAGVALASGFEVKVSEIHGMAQRGGSVNTVVRFGDKVASMVNDPGCADYVVAFETTEALRALPQLSPTGKLIVNDESIKPLPVLTGKAAMPHDVYAQLEEQRALIVPARSMAEEVGNAHTVNVALLGALAADLPLELEAWETVIADRVPPATIEANREAFKAGVAFGREHEA